MSTTPPATDGPTADHDRVDELATRLDQALDRIDELETAVEQQAETIEELEAEVESRTPIRWDGESPADIEVEHDAGWSFPLGGMLSTRADEEVVDEIRDDVDQLIAGGVDPADAVGLTGDDEPALPIEDTIGQLRSEMREDPSANKARASIVFQAFGGRANNTKGGKLVLKSPAVRSILEDPDKGNMDSVNNNTLKRTMHQCAKLTSPESTPRDRSARDPENLITLEERGGKLALVADTDEWHEYLKEVEARLTQ